MGNNRPVKTKCWVLFLESKNCVYKGISSSHTLYKCPNCKRTIVFWGNKKEVPAMQLKTNLQTLNSNLQELYTWIENNC